MASESGGGWAAVVAPLIVLGVFLLIFWILYKVFTLIWEVIHNWYIRRKQRKLNKR